MRALILLKVVIGGLVLSYSSAFAHSCKLLGNNAADIMLYNQCIADQNREAKIEEVINGYEDEIEKLTQDKIRLERRIAKIKSSLSAIISAY